MSRSIDADPPGSAGSKSDIYWMRTRDVYPGEWLPQDFVAFDGETLIGRAYQYEIGPQQGQWMYAMGVERPGPPFYDRSGTVASRAEAARRLVEAYRTFMARF